jgi:hypothetical protein
MTPKRLNILCMWREPVSPPHIGYQAQIQGVMTQLARRHNLTSVTRPRWPTFRAGACLMNAMLRYPGQITGPHLPRRQALPGIQDTGSGTFVRELRCQ